MSAGPAPPPGPGGRVRFSAPYSWGTVGMYVGIILLLLVFAPASNTSTLPYASEILAVLFLVFLARYLSTSYYLDATTFTAWRLFGLRRIALRDVRAIQFGNLRELSPVGFLGSWGWRGRMWSPVLGRFDSVYTVPFGVVVRGGPVPLFVSPRDPPGFARELSRRVRSYTGPLDEDVGAPRVEPEPVTDRA